MYVLYNFCPLIAKMIYFESIQHLLFSNSFSFLRIISIDLYFQNFKWTIVTTLNRIISSGDCAFFFSLESGVVIKQ